MPLIDPQNLPFLPIDKGSSLILTDSKSTTRKGMDNDDDFYDEVNANGEIIAKYHVWHYLNIYPPQKVEEGWRKTLPDGTLVTSGKKS